MSTAGLDPEERVRFHNLIGENVIVILSTHIVAHVADFCRNMAINHQGRVLAAGDPIALSRDLRGRIWQTEAAGDAVEGYGARFPVIDVHLAAGLLLVRVFADEQPAPEFAAAEPELEDIYFSTVRRAA